MKPIQKALLGNAIFSLLSGSLLILFSKDLAQLMAISHPEVLFYIGLGLLGFVVMLLFHVFRRHVSKGQIRQIIFMDWGWVIGSLILLIWNPFEISMEGNILIGSVALVVMMFAIWQARTLPYS